jgi:hypothetical protein
MCDESFHLLLILCILLTLTDGRVVLVITIPSIPSSAVTTRIGRARGNIAAPVATGPIACIVWVCAELALKDAREVIESGFGGPDEDNPRDAHLSQTARRG